MSAQRHHAPHLQQFRDGLAIQAVRADRVMRRLAEAPRMTSRAKREANKTSPDLNDWNGFDKYSLRHLIPQDATDAGGILNLSNFFVKRDNSPAGAA